jgi:hypothetical protein
MGSASNAIFQCCRRRVHAIHAVPLQACMAHRRHMRHTSSISNKGLYPFTVILIT